MAFPKAIKTERTYKPEYGTRLPVYRGPAICHENDRVELDDGRVCFVTHDNMTSDLPTLSTELVAMDAGDNVVRRRKASEGSNGICAPAIPRTSIYLTAVAPAASIIGYYEEV